VSHKTQSKFCSGFLKCGGLLLVRHEPPLTRRFVVYYCSAVYNQLSAIVGVKPACQALAVPRASWYRRRNRRLFPTPSAVLRCSPRALTEAEQQAVLSSLYEDRFQDSSPAQVYAALLDEGQFHCSIRTMYRLLEARGGSGE
jgi:putative transposase